MSLTLKVSTDTVGFFLNYGLTDRLDVGLALPLVTVDMAASLRFIFVNRQGRRSARPTRSVRAAAASRVSATSSRGAKYNVFKQAGGGAAVGLDLRLPTGDEDNLHRDRRHAGEDLRYLLGGVRAFQSACQLRLHVLAGQRRDSRLDSVLFEPPSEVNYTFGVDFAIRPRLTVAVDIVGRSLARYLPARAVGDPFGLGTAFEEFERVGQDDAQHGADVVRREVQRLRQSAGHGQRAVPTTKGGLRDKFTPVIGMDYSF